MNDLGESRVMQYAYKNEKYWKIHYIALQYFLKRYISMNTINSLIES